MTQHHELRSKPCLLLNFLRLRISPYAFLRWLTDAQTEYPVLSVEELRQLLNSPGVSIISIENKKDKLGRPVILLKIMIKKNEGAQYSTVHAFPITNEYRDQIHLLSQKF